MCGTALRSPYCSATGVAPCSPPAPAAYEHTLPALVKHPALPGTATPSSAPSVPSSPAGNVSLDSTWAPRTLPRGGEAVPAQRAAPRGAALLRRDLRRRAEPGPATRRNLPLTPIAGGREQLTPSTLPPSPAGLFWPFFQHPKCPPCPPVTPSPCSWGQQGQTHPVSAPLLLLGTPESRGGD